MAHGGDDHSHEGGGVEQMGGNRVLLHPARLTASSEGQQMKGTIKRGSGKRMITLGHKASRLIGDAPEAYHVSKHAKQKQHPSKLKGKRQ
jgi:hypothetical protein